MKTLNEIYGSFDPEYLRNRIAEVNRDIRTMGIRYHEPADKELLTGYSYGEFYDWDLYFENIYMSYFGISTYCFENVKEFLNLQYLDGFVPRTIGSNPSRLFQHFKPFLAQTALLGSAQEDDFSWLEERDDRGLRKLITNVSWYEQLKMYLDYWFYYMDFDRNGLPVWMDADQSGMDNQYNRLGILREAKAEGVDLACYLYRELEAMKWIAHKLGYEEDSRNFENHARALKGLINEILWNEKEGFYFDRNEKTGEAIHVKSVAGFLPLWAGIASEDQAGRLIRDHLLNPDEFWRNYPVASLSATESGFTPGEWKGYGCNWLGTTWIPTNYVIMHGLRNYGFHDLAGELAIKSLDLVLMKNHVTREYYNSETGDGLGLDPFWGWSALAYFMPMEHHLDYDPTRIGELELRSYGNEIFGLDFWK